MSCTIGAATHLYACPPLPNLKIETPREQLKISRSLETDKDVQQVLGDVPQTFLLVVSIRSARSARQSNFSAMGRKGALARLSARSELETLLTENAVRCLPLVREKKSSKCDGLRPGCQANRIASRRHTRATSVLFAQAPQTLPCAATVWEQAGKPLVMQPWDSRPVAESRSVPTGQTQTRCRSGPRPRCPQPVFPQTDIKESDSSHLRVRSAANWKVTVRRLRRCHKKMEKTCMAKKFTKNLD